MPVRDELLDQYEAKLIRVPSVPKEERQPMTIEEQRLWVARPEVFETPTF